MLMQVARVTWMGVELTRHDFYQRLPGYKIPPTTSFPGTDAFIRAYEQAIQDGAIGIVSVHVSANFSNLINMARLAAETVTTVPITVVDSGQLSLGEGLLALAGAEASQKGATQAEIVSQIRDMAQRTYIFGILDTLEYLRRSGRASRLKASLSLWLDIKPVFIVNQGEVTIEKTRTRRKATERLLRQIEEMSPLERVALIHSHPSTERMASFTQQAHQRLHLNGSLITAEVTPTIGTHVGPAALGLVVVKARQDLYWRDRFTKPWNKHRLKFRQRLVPPGRAHRSPLSDR
jgi:DegV family protein with EDD domain